MKYLGPDLQEHLESGTTTLCWCWRISRRDGQRLGFTDHDVDLQFDGTTFEASTGFTATEMHEAVGLSSDNLEVESALTSDRLSEAALVSGDFDDAGIEIFRVNWQDPTERVVLRSGSLGEVRRSGSAFSAEIRGLAHYLQQQRGRVFQYGCDADLGDRRCGIDLGRLDLSGSGTILSVVSDRILMIGGVAASESGLFTRGRLSITSGANAGRGYTVKRHWISRAAVYVELWEAVLVPPVPGDAFIIKAGCDKQFETCRSRFSNTINYRGFPHMPGNDFLTTAPISA